MRNNGIRMRNRASARFGAKSLVIDVRLRIYPKELFTVIKGIYPPMLDQCKCPGINRLLPGQATLRVAIHTQG